MRKIWDVALNNPYLLGVPAVGLILCLLILRIKKLYINEGVFFGRSTVLPRDTTTPNSDAEDEMPSEN